VDSTTNTRPAIGFGATGPNYGGTVTISGDSEPSVSNTVRSKSPLKEQNKGDLRCHTKNYDLTLIPVKLTVDVMFYRLRLDRDFRVPVCMFPVYDWHWNPTQATSSFSRITRAWDDHFYPNLYAINEDLSVSQFRCILGESISRIIGNFSNLTHMAVFTYDQDNDYIVPFTLGMIVGNQDFSVLGHEIIDYRDFISDLVLFSKLPTNVQPHRSYFTPKPS